jgi:hypothetical protein
MRQVRGLYVLLLIASAAGIAAMSQVQNSPNSDPGKILQSSTDQDTLERAAISLAHSGTAGDLELLGQFLRDPQFLSRLDPLPDRQTLHLKSVMAALAERPTPQVANLCLRLAEDPAFMAVDDRTSFLLVILAKVKPMSQQTVDVFRDANERGYFGFNVRLLTANASPRALAQFETMMLDKDTPVESRVECLHVSVLPHRTELPILQAGDQIVSRASERGIIIGVIESVFDFRQTWFGIESKISGPPAWQTASPDSLRFAAALAAKVLQRRDLTASLHNKVEHERGTIVGLLSAR